VWALRLEQLARSFLLDESRPHDWPVCNGGLKQMGNKGFNDLHAWLIQQIRQEYLKLKRA
jgi:hypothetical protein